MLVDPAALEAAIALQLLCPQIPLIFMGEETASDTPFLFFTDHNEELAQAVRDGRRREFSGFQQFNDPVLLQKIPDPNATETFGRSRPRADEVRGDSRQELYRTLLTLRRKHILPRLAGARARDAKAVGPAAVTASWCMGDSAMLMLACNLGQEVVAIEPLPSAVLFATSEAARRSAREWEARALHNDRAPGAAMTDDAVYNLARRAGIAVDWRDYANRPHRVSLDTLRCVLAALGLPCETADDLSHSRRSLDEHVVPPLITATVGQPVHLSCRRRHAAAASRSIR